MTTATSWNQLRGSYQARLQRRGQKKLQVFHAERRPSRALASSGDMSKPHYQRAELRWAFWSRNVPFALAFLSWGKFWYGRENKCRLLENPDLKHYKTEDILQVRLVEGLIKDMAPQVRPNSWSSNLDAVTAFKIELALHSASWRGRFDLFLMCFSAPTSAL